MIDILIPTYNRAKDLEKNIKHLDRLLSKEGLLDNYRLLVSDNCSTDSTKAILEQLRNCVCMQMIVYEQSENIGLEKNSIFLLEKATSDFVMYIGDDDFLPEGYLSYVFEKNQNDVDLGVIIPGILALYGDGTTSDQRKMRFDERCYESGFLTTYKTAYLGHQLSGVLQKREGLLDKYLADKSLRNIYPFIFFLGFNAMRGNVYFVPRFRVLVSVSNSKDWGYDRSGLLTEIFKNFRILFPADRIKRVLMCISVMCYQTWRLRIGKDVRLAFDAFIHIMMNNNVDPLIKIVLPFLYMYLYPLKTAQYVCHKAMVR